MIISDRICELLLDLIRIQAKHGTACPPISLQHIRQSNTSSELDSLEICVQLFKDERIARRVNVKLVCHQINSNNILNRLDCYHF